MDGLTLLLHAPVLNLQLLVDGVLVGAIFALVAYGMALLWGVMNLINVAQGDFVIIGGYVAFFAVSGGVPPLLAVPCSAAVVALGGWVLYRIGIPRVGVGERFTSIPATYGMRIGVHQLPNR